MTCLDRIWWVVVWVFPDFRRRKLKFRKGKGNSQGEQHISSKSILENHVAASETMIALYLHKGSTAGKKGEG